MSVNSCFQFIANILVETAILSQGQITEFEKKFSTQFPQTHEALETFIIQKGLISESSLLKAYSLHLNIPVKDLASIDIDPQVISLISAKFAERNKIIPIEKQGLSLVVAMRNPFVLQVIDELKILTGYKIVTVLAKCDEIMASIERNYNFSSKPLNSINPPLAEDIKAGQSVSVEEVKPQNRSKKDNSVLSEVKSILLEAYQKNALYVHFEPLEDKFRIRYRIDGILKDAELPAGINQSPSVVVSQLKIMAGIKLTEKRRLQNGLCRINLGEQAVDFKVSIFPTMFGEGARIRILRKKNPEIKLEELGWDALCVEKIKVILKKTSGIIMAVGPNGCGKTTTIYSLINHLNSPNVNIITLEEAIECQVDGVTQIQVNPQADLTFANGLISVLDQDADIVMLDEIRDAQTAKICIHAALSGQLVLSTMRANDAASALISLLDQGISPYMISGAVKAVIAQRLVRKICVHCKTKYVPDRDILDAVGFDDVCKAPAVFHKGSGCLKCDNSGFSGRLGLYEILVIDESLAECINSKVSMQQLKTQAVKNNMVSIKNCGIQKVRQGLTTVEEVLKII